MPIPSSRVWQTLRGSCVVLVSVCWNTIWCIFFADYKKVCFEKIRLIFIFQHSKVVEKEISIQAIDT